MDRPLSTHRPSPTATPATTPDPDPAVAAASHRSGLGYGIGAYALWGLVPLYWPLLQPGGAVEILAHRMVWTLGFVAVLLTVTRRWQAIRAMSWRVLGLLAIAATVITVNWGGFIWGVNNGHVLEISLGYFINPLVTVVIAVLVLHERLRPLQWTAVGVAVVAVAVLTFDYGRPPWLALVLAFSFALYGLLRKKADVGTIEGLGVETLILLLPAAGYLVYLQAIGQGNFGQHGLGMDLLFIGAGLVTGIPLLLFGASATRIPLTTLGLLQYIGPSLQFILGVFYFGESVPPVRLMGFGLVWLALVVFTVESMRHRRQQIRMTAEPGPS